jgi:two-component system chemotaxis response regulator CheB
MKPVRVLIVDDSTTLREVIAGLLAADPALEVVGQAVNGAEAVAMTRELQPQVITMDLEMPVMGGIDAISSIMAENATPILVLSSVADAAIACEAVARGALEVIDKSPESLSRNLCRRLRLLAGVPVIRHLQRSKPVAVAAMQSGAMELSPPAPRNAFFIASSTGGPQRLAELLARLPADFPAPILIAQHISNGFSTGMVEWLNSLTPLTVRLASDGMAIAPGEVLVAPSEYNTVVARSGRLGCEASGDGDIYHPSCDRLLESGASHYGSRAIGIILTGMGRDGVKGICAIRQAGGVTLAQDEASSAIFGMNRLAIESGCVQRVVDPDGLVAEMVWLAESRR